MGDDKESEDETELTRPKAFKLPVPDRPADSVPAKVTRYAARLLAQYDENGDGRLQQQEWARLLWRRYDRNRDGQLQHDELEPLVQLRLRQILRDYDDGDRQLQLEEFGRFLVPQYDKDGDGRLNADEIGEKVLAYYDKNADQLLDAVEAAAAFLPYYDVTNKDGALQEHELLGYVRLLYDRDRDGQLQGPEWERLGRDLWQGLASQVNSDGPLGVDQLTGLMAAYGTGLRMRLMVSSDKVDADFEPVFNPVSAPEDASADTAGELPGEGDRAEAAAGPPRPGPPPTDPRERMKYFVPRSRLAGLPDWFLRADANGDGQVTLAEYAPKISQTSLAGFYRYDLNRDGVITAAECVPPAKAKETSAQPRKTSPSVKESKKEALGKHAEKE
jgi:Ca2+-binding EF-hand superfamily protein